MRKNPYFELDDVDQIGRLIVENPWATLVSNASGGLVASTIRFCSTRTAATCRS